ncbi:MAG: class I tRNA ligase family protein [Terriglobales bacterium]
MEGIHRFLSRLWRWAEAPGAPFAGRPSDGRAAEGTRGGGAGDEAALRKTHQTLRRITHDFDGRWHFNTSIAALMELLNELLAGEAVLSPAARNEVTRLLLLMLQPFAPFVAQELWQRRGESGMIARAHWPEYEARLGEEDEVEIMIQVNGKLRDRMRAPRNAGREELEEAARGQEKIRALLDGRTPRQVIVVPGRLVNIVLP